MKQHKWLLPTIVFMMSSLLLDACNYLIQVLPTSTSSPLTATQTAMPPTATQTPAPPTPIPPSATPTLISISANTISMLEIFESFELGDVVRTLAFTPDGAYLAAAGGNNQVVPIRIWDVASGCEISSLQGHNGIVWGVAFSPDGQTLASVSSDATAKVWDWDTGTLVKSLDFPGQVVSVSFSPDGQSLAVGGVDTPQNQILNAAIWTYSVGTWEPLVKFSEFWNIGVMAYGPKGRTLIGGGTSRNVQVWRTSDGARLFTLSHAHQVSDAAISQDGSTLATGTCITVVNHECTDGGVWLWDLLTEKLIDKLGGFPNVVESLAFSADGSALIVGSRDGTLRVYATSDYTSRFETTSAGGIQALTLSPDGGLLSTGNASGEVHLWKIVYHP